MIVVLSATIAFLSTLFPYLALIPAVGFCIRGLWLLFNKDTIIRDGGIVLLLTGFAWAVFTAVQASLLAWSHTVSGAIRIDILASVPIMTLASILGWLIHSRLPTSLVRSGAP
jgi:hypothetical protein